MIDKNTVYPSSFLFKYVCIQLVYLYYSVVPAVDRAPYAPKHLA